MSISTYKITFIATVIAVFSGLLLQAQSIVYQPLFTNANFTKTIDTQRPVGSTAAAADVTPGGGASNSIPIAVPASTNGMAPRIALVYNSQGGDGPLGWGWSISGLSSIIRVPRNHHFDSKTEGVELTADDRFALDGVRLIGVSGTYGAHNATYATESESFAAITSYGSLGGGPERFEVTTKDGLIMEYGNSTDSRVPGSGAVLFWRLNKIRSQEGNYIEFKYVNTLLRR